MKTLLWVLLLACPPVAMCLARMNEAPGTDSNLRPVSRVVSSAPVPEALHIPIEVVTEGDATKWVYVEIQAQSVPEPGIASLTLLASLLLLRRRR